MNREEEKDELNVSSANIAVAPVLAAAEPMPAVALAQPQPERVRHVYLEEENVYGRFVPFLLLKDKLHSQIDSSGSSALVHMCSHNSPYIPLYLSTLKHGDPILNRPTNLGHTPLDVAGMYCKKEYIDLLRAKGAVDDGKVDNWAIQGANIANWSGNVDPTKKALIHWAAYNNLPEVLAKYAELGADVNESDHNGNTPIDLAVLNKSYESV
jgi:ankyrin repeat protein